MAAKLSTGLDIRCSIPYTSDTKLLYGSSTQSSRLSIKRFTILCNSTSKSPKQDDRLCGCLLSVVFYCKGDEADKVLACLQQANPRLVTFFKMLKDESTSYDVVKVELFRSILTNTSDDATRPFCNCLIDICRKGSGAPVLATVYGLYPSSHTKTPEEWMRTLARIVQTEETLPEALSANIGAGTHKFSQGLANSHIEKLAAPFKQSEERALVSWVQSKATTTA